MRTTSRASGYSLAELLTVVSIIGLVGLASIPALMQLMPQYRMRSATSELASAMRIARQNAIGTRRPWRVQFDAAGSRYAIGELNSPTASLATYTNWVKIGENDRPVVGSAAAWKSLSFMSMNTSGFHDVDCHDGVDVVFLRDGSVSDAFNSTCSAGGTSALTFSPRPYVRLHYNSSMVRYNTYYVYADSSGYITTDQTKE